MLVSTRLATVVEILPLPVPLGAGLLWQLQELFSFSLTLGGLVEQPQTFFDAEPGRRPATRRGRLLAGPIPCRPRIPVRYGTVPCSIQ